MTTLTDFLRDRSDAVEAALGLIILAMAAIVALWARRAGHLRTELEMTRRTLSAALAAAPAKSAAGGDGSTFEEALSRIARATGGPGAAVLSAGAAPAKTATPGPATPTAAPAGHDAAPARGASAGAAWAETPGRGSAAAAGGPEHAGPAAAKPETWAGALHVVGDDEEAGGRGAQPSTWAQIPVGGPEGHHTDEARSAHEPTATVEAGPRATPEKADEDRAAAVDDDDGATRGSEPAAEHPGDGAGEREGDAANPAAATAEPAADDDHAVAAETAAGRADGEDADGAAGTPAWPAAIAPAGGGEDRGHGAAADEIDRSPALAGAGPRPFLLSPSTDAAAVASETEPPAGQPEDEAHAERAEPSVAEIAAHLGDGAPSDAAGTGAASEDPEKAATTAYAAWGKVTAKKPPSDHSPEDEADLENDLWTAPAPLAPWLHRAAQEAVDVAAQSDDGGAAAPWVEGPADDQLAGNGRRPPLPGVPPAAAESAEVEVVGDSRVELRWVYQTAAPAHAEAPPAQPAASPAETSVLLVEDDENVSKLYRLLLESKGYRMRHAADGVDALDLVREQRPDLILLDVMMPRMNGILFLQTLREDPENRELPVVVLSNFREPRLVERAMALGALEYMVKAQTRPDALLSALPRWLRGERAFSR